MFPPASRDAIRRQKVRAFHYPAAVLLSAAMFVCGCSSKSTPTSASTTPSTTKAAAPAKKIDFEKPVVKIDTSAGFIKLRLDGIRAPGTVRNFLNYVNEGFYDNTLVHYVDPGKMILAGGYSADRKPKAPHPPIRNEAHNGSKNTRGTIAMARDESRIDSATSQFFINLADAPQRDHTGDTAAEYGYCVFGEVTEGLEVAQKISQSPTTNLSGDLLQTPEPPVVIKAVRIVQ